MYYPQVRNRGRNLLAHPVTCVPANPAPCAAGGCHWDAAWQAPVQLLVCQPREVPLCSSDPEPARPQPELLPEMTPAHMQDFAFVFVSRNNF